jgi:hypothetical protein
MSFIKRVNLLAALAKVVNTEIYYHGTTSKFGLEILKQGFRSDIKNKVWDQSKKHLESYGKGTYFSNSVEVAGRAAAAAVGKYKGNMWIFQVNLMPEKGYLDEDELPPMGNMLDNKIVNQHDDIDDAEEHIVKDAVDSWFAYFQDELGGTITQTIKINLTPLLESWAYNEIYENFDEIKKNKIEIIKILKGQAHTLNVQNIKMPKVAKSDILSVIQFDFIKGKPKIKIMYGTPKSFFLEDVERFNEEEIRTQEKLYFKED